MTSSDSTFCSRLGVANVIYGTPQLVRRRHTRVHRPRRMTLYDLRSLPMQDESETPSNRKGSSGTIRSESGISHLHSNKVEISDPMPIQRHPSVGDGSSNMRSKQISSPIQPGSAASGGGAASSLSSSGSGGGGGGRSGGGGGGAAGTLSHIRFPKLEEYAHFHYDVVEIPSLKVTLLDEESACYKHNQDSNPEGVDMYIVEVSSTTSKPWMIRRSLGNFATLDQQLHRCIFDRRFSHLADLKTTQLDIVDRQEIQAVLHGYLSRFSELAGGMVNCGSVLSWMEMDNRGHHLVATDDSGINTPAIAAAHVVKRYTAQAADEISLQVGDMISVIDMPPAEDTIWWRGKRGFEVGFFPCDCVEVIKDKIPSGMTSLFSSSTSSSSSAAASSSSSSSSSQPVATAAASRKPCEDKNDLHHHYHPHHHHPYFELGRDDSNSDLNYFNSSSDDGDGSLTGSSSSIIFSPIPIPHPPPKSYNSTTTNSTTNTPLLSRSTGSSGVSNTNSAHISSSTSPSMSSSFSASAGISSSAGSSGGNRSESGGRATGPATLPRCAATFPLPLAPSAYDCSPTMMRKHGKLLSFLRTFFSHRPPRNQLKQSGIVKERVFGCDLGEHLLNSGHDVPLLLKSCTEIIEEYGIVHGIYRLSGITSNIQKLRLAFDEDRVPDLTEECYLQDIHSISSLLKMYFRELPNPLLTYQLYDKFADAVKDEENKLLKIHDVVQQLPPPHYRTTEYLMRHLSRVANFGPETEMHSKNLAIVWAPNLLRSKELEAGGGAAALQGVGIQAVVTECLICYCDIIFSDKMPNYATQELLKGQKKPRPKSLAISTPTRLLSLEEARERAIVGHLNPRHTKFIDVGGGPKNLPSKYHTVLDVQGYKKKSSSKDKEKENKPHGGKKSPYLSGRSTGGSATAAAAGSGGGWKSIFSKQRPSSIKKGRKGAGLEPTQLHSLQAKALTEEDVHNWKRNLRSSKSAESLFALSGSLSSQRVGGNDTNDDDTETMDSSTDGMTHSAGGGSDRQVSLTPNMGRSSGKGLRTLTHKRSLSSDASAVLHHRFMYDEPKGARSPGDVDDDDELSPNPKTTFTRGDSTRRALPRRVPSAPSTPQQDKKMMGKDKNSGVKPSDGGGQQRQLAFEPMELDGEEFSYRKSVTGGDIDIDLAIKTRLKQVSDHSMKSMLTDEDLATTACAPLKRCAKTPPKGRKRGKQQKPSSASASQHDNCNSEKPPLVSKANSAASGKDVNMSALPGTSHSLESSPDDPQSRRRHFYAQFHDYAEIVSDEESGGATTTPSSQGTMSLSSSGCNMQDVLDQIDSRLALHAKQFPRLGIGDGTGGGGVVRAAGSSQSSSSSSPYPDRSPINPHAQSSSYPNCEEHPYAVIPARQPASQQQQSLPSTSSSSVLPSPSSTSTSFPATASNVLTKETEFSVSLSPSSTSLQSPSRETEFPAMGNTSPREHTVMSQSNNRTQGEAIKSSTTHDLSSYSSNRSENRNSLNHLSHQSFSDNDVSIIKTKTAGGRSMSISSSSASSSCSSSPQKLPPHQRIQKLQQSGKGVSNPNSSTRVERRRAEFIPSSKAGSADLNNLEDLLDNLETGSNKSGVSSPTMQGNKLRYAGSGRRKHHHHHHHSHHQQNQLPSRSASLNSSPHQSPHHPHPPHHFYHHKNQERFIDSSSKPPKSPSLDSRMISSARESVQYPTHQPSSFSASQFGDSDRVTTGIGMCKCLSVPSDIARSLENVLGSQSDILSSVTISELSASMTSFGNGIGEMNTSRNNSVLPPCPRRENDPAQRRSSSLDSLNNDNDRLITRTLREINEQIETAFKQGSGGAAPVIDSSSSTGSALHRNHHHRPHMIQRLISSDNDLPASSRADQFAGQSKRDPSYGKQGVCESCGCMVGGSHSSAASPLPISDQTITPTQYSCSDQNTPDIFQFEGREGEFYEVVGGAARNEGEEDDDVEEYSGDEGDSGFVFVPGNCVANAGSMGVDEQSIEAPLRQTHRHPDDCLIKDSPAVIQSPRCNRNRGNKRRPVDEDNGVKGLGQPVKSPCDLVSFDLPSVTKRGSTATKTTSRSTSSEEFDEVASPDEGDDVDDVNMKENDIELSQYDNTTSSSASVQYSEMENRLFSSSNAEPDESDKGSSSSSLQHHNQQQQGGGGGAVSRDFTLPLNQPQTSPQHQRMSPLSPTSSSRGARVIQRNSSRDEAPGSGTNSPMLSPQNENVSPVVIRRLHSPRGMTGSGNVSDSVRFPHPLGQRQPQQHQQQQQLSNQPAWLDQSSSLSPSTLRSALSPAGGHHHPHHRGLDTDKKVRGQSSTGDLVDTDNPSLLQWRQSGLFNDSNNGDDDEGISSLCAVGFMSQRARLSRESSNSSLQSPDVSFSSGTFPSLPHQQPAQQQASSSSLLSSSSSSVRSPPPHALPDVVQSASAQNTSNDDSVFSSSSLSPPLRHHRYHHHPIPHHRTTAPTQREASSSSSSAATSSTTTQDNNRDVSRDNRGNLSSISSGGESPSTAPLRLALYHPDEFSMDIEASITNCSPNLPSSSIPNSASLPQVHTSQDTVTERKARMSKSSTENAISERQRQASGKAGGNADTSVGHDSSDGIFSSSSLSPRGVGRDSGLPREEILASNFVRGGEGRQPQPARREKNRRRNREREDMQLHHQGVGDGKQGERGHEKNNREQEAAMEVDNLCNKLVDEMKSPTSTVPPMVFPPPVLPTGSPSSFEEPMTMETEEREESDYQQSSAEFEPHPSSQETPMQKHQRLVEESQNTLNSHRESSLLRTVSSPATVSPARSNESPPPFIPQVRKSSVSKIPRPKTSGGNSSSSGGGGGGGDMVNPHPSGFQRSYSARLPSPVLINTTTPTIIASPRSSKSGGESPQSSSFRRGSETTSSSSGYKRLGHARRSSDTKLSDIRSGGGGNGSGDSHSPSSSSSRPASSSARYSSRSKTFSHHESKHSSSSPDGTNPRSRIPLSHRIPSPNSSDRSHQQDNSTKPSSSSPSSKQNQQQQSTKKQTSPYPKPRRSSSSKSGSCTGTTVKSTSSSSFSSSDQQRGLEDSSASETTRSSTRNEGQSRRNSSGTGKSRESGAALSSSGESKPKVIVKDLKVDGGAKLVIESQPELKKKIQTVHAKKVSQPPRQLAEALGNEGSDGLYIDDVDSANPTSQVSFAVDSDNEGEGGKKKLHSSNDMKIPPPVAKKKFKFNSKSLPRKGKKGEGFSADSSSPMQVPLSQHLSDVEKTYPDLVSSRSSLDDSILQLAAERQEILFDDDDEHCESYGYSTGSLRVKRSQRLQSLVDLFEKGSDSNISESSGNSPVTRHRTYSASSAASGQLGDQPLTTYAEDMMNPLECSFDRASSGAGENRMCSQEKERYPRRKNVSESEDDHHQHQQGFSGGVEPAVLRHKDRTSQKKYQVDAANPEDFECSSRSVSSSGRNRISAPPVLASTAQSSSSSPSSSALLNSSSLSPSSSSSASSSTAVSPGVALRNSSNSSSRPPRYQQAQPSTKPLTRTRTLSESSAASASSECDSLHIAESGGSTTTSPQLSHRLPPTSSSSTQRASRSRAHSSSSIEIETTTTSSPPTSPKGGNNKNKDIERRGSIKELLLMFEKTSSGSGNEHEQFINTDNQDFLPPPTAPPRVQRMRSVSPPAVQHRESSGSRRDRVNLMRLSLEIPPSSSDSTSGSGHHNLHHHSLDFGNKTQALRLGPKPFYPVSSNK